MLCCCVVWCGAAHLKRVQHVLKAGLLLLLRCRELSSKADAITNVLREMGYRDEALQVRKQMDKISGKRYERDSSSSAAGGGGAEADPTEADAGGAGGAKRLRASDLRSNPNIRNLESNLQGLGASQESSEAKLVPTADFHDPAFKQLLERLAALPSSLISELVIRSFQNYTLSAEQAAAPISPLFLAFLDQFKRSTEPDAKATKEDDEPMADSAPDTAASAADSSAASAAPEAITGGSSGSGGAAGASAAASAAAPAATRPVRQNVTAPPIPVPVLSSAQCSVMARSSFLRILNADTENAVATAGPTQLALRASLLSKIVAWSELDAGEAQSLSTYILADFGARYEVALRWLYALFAARRPNAARPAGSNAAVAAKNRALESINGPASRLPDSSAGAAAPADSAAMSDEDGGAAKSDSAAGSGGSEGEGDASMETVDGTLSVCMQTAPF